jgi:hypothetical protein
VKAANAQKTMSSVNVIALFMRDAFARCGPGEPYLERANNKNRHREGKKFKAV